MTDGHAGKTSKYSYFMYFLEYQIMHVAHRGGVEVAARWAVYGWPSYSELIILTAVKLFLPRLKVLLLQLK